MDQQQKTFYSGEKTGLLRMLSPTEERRYLPVKEYEQEDTRE